MDNWQDWTDILNTTDVHTAKLIVQLQLEDVQGLSARKGNSALRSDADLARQLYEEELSQLRADLPDRQLGEELEDGDNELEETFEGAARGWHLNHWENRIEYDQQLVARPLTPPPPPVQLITCTVCTDDCHPTKITTVPCGHHYCDDCLEGLYNSCMTDEALFPPRCCHQDFPWELVKAHLSQRCRSKFGSKRIELETTDRTYCHVPTCSAFIRPDTYIGNLAPCPKKTVCGWNTCIACKGQYHFGFACPRDEALDSIMGAAARNGWQQCFACHRIIELKTGCNHMTCICKTEFCYICGLQWKTCECPQWDEERLVERAVIYVDIDQGPAAANDPNRQAQIADMAEHLRANHECEHQRFKNLNQPGGMWQCELCEVRYEHWIYYCRDCLMIICNRCRHNRL